LAGSAIFWEVDVQRDFMLPDGRLYVPGAEKIRGNINLLVDAARRGRVFLVSSADAHRPDDPELREWPAHCLKGTQGAELLPEACASPRLVIPNEKGFQIPGEVGAYKQVTLEKNTLDVFDNPNTDILLGRLRAGEPEGKSSRLEFVVFGVATEYCVRCTVEGLLHRGKSVAIAGDAIRAIETENGEKILKNLIVRGARVISTEEALQLAEGQS
jgi:nicotinamidase/pyrazinamidase